MAVSDADFLQLKEQVEAIALEMGSDPSGIFSNIRNRLDSISTLVNNLQAATLVNMGGDLSGVSNDAHVIKLNGHAVSSVVPQDNFVMTWNDTTSQWEPQATSGFTAAGDLFGNASTQKVIAIQGRAIASTAPINGQVLSWNAGFSSWVPTNAGSGTFLAGGDLSGTDSSQQVIGLQNRPLLDTVPTNGQAIVWNGSAWAPGSVAASVTFAGDLSGNTSTQTVTGIRGFNILATTPTIDQVLTFNGTNWAPTAAPTGFTAGGDLSGSSSSQTVVAIRNIPVSSILAQDGYVLTHDASLNQIKYRFVSHKEILSVSSAMFSFSGTDFTLPIVVGHIQINKAAYPANSVVSVTFTGKKTNTMDSIIEIEEIGTATIYTGVGWKINTSSFTQVTSPTMALVNGTGFYEVRVKPDTVAGSLDGFVLSELAFQITY